MRLSLALLFVCLAGCSLTKEGPEQPTTPASTDEPAPAMPEAPIEQEPTEPLTPPLSEEDPAPPAIVEELPWSPPEEPGRTWEETDPLPPVEETRKGLFETLTSNYGVRLPHSNSHLSLEAAIGSGGWSVDFDRDRAAGARVFAREIIVGISKSDIFVNDFRVAKVTCSTPEGLPCPESFDGSQSNHIYQVPGEMLGHSAEDAFVIPPLLKQLQDLQRVRREVLHRMNEEAATWLLDCDVFTLAADRTIPFDFIVKVIHTAGFADLTRVRLATLDDDNNLTYVPLLSPRLDHAQRKVEHLLGDGWWQRQQREPDEAFAYAYINYSASPYPETFAATTALELPACLPPEFAWQKVIEDPEFARITQEKILAYIGETRSSHGQILGLEPFPSPPAGLAMVTPPAVPPLPAPAEDEALAAGAADGFPASRLLLAKETPPPPDVADDVIATEETQEEESAEPEVLSLRPFAFIGTDEVVVALRTPEGPLFQAIAVPRSDPDRLYDFLAASRGWTLGISARLSLPTEDLVVALDMLSYRCMVHTMSGRCKKWSPVLPHLYLFLPPGNSFAPLPARDTVTPPPPVPLNVPDGSASKAATPGGPGPAAAPGEEAYPDADSPILP